MAIPVSYHSSLRLQSVFSGGPFRSSQQPAAPVPIQGTWSGGEEPPGGGAPAHGGPHPGRSSSGTGSVPAAGGPDTSQRLSMGGSGEVVPASAFHTAHRPQQQQQQQQQRQAAPNMASDPSASSSAQVRDLQHRISVLESQLQASRKCRAWPGVFMRWWPSWGGLSWGGYCQS